MTGRQLASGSVWEGEGDWDCIFTIGSLEQHCWRTTILQYAGMSQPGLGCECFIFDPYYVMLFHFTEKNAEGLGGEVSLGNILQL